MQIKCINYITNLKHSLKLHQIDIYDTVFLHGLYNLYFKLKNTCLIFHIQLTVHYQWYMLVCEMLKYYVNPAIHKLLDIQRKVLIAE